MTKKIISEQPFEVNAHSFAVYSDSGYTLAYSADGVHFTNYTESTPAGETLFVNGVPKGATFKLIGNGAEATITY